MARTKSESGETETKQIIKLTINFHAMRRTLSSTSNTRARHMLAFWLFRFSMPVALSFVSQFFFYRHGAWGWYFFIVESTENFLPKVQIWILNASNPSKKRTFIGIEMKDGTGRWEKKCQADEYCKKIPTTYTNSMERGLLQKCNGSEIIPILWKE